MERTHVAIAELVDRIDPTRRDLDPCRHPERPAVWNRSPVHGQSPDLALTERIIVRFSQSGRPIDRYSVVLMALVDGEWHTVRVYDNHLRSHHMHRYTRSGGKQGSEEFHPGPTNDAIPAAIAHLQAHWEAIIESWAS